MKTEEKPTLEDVLELFEKPIVAYVQELMVKVGMPVDKKGAENIVSNVGANILQRKLKQERKERESLYEL